MTPQFTHQGTPVTPGQALDVWLGSVANAVEHAQPLSNAIHVFGDFAYGHTGPAHVMRRIGIEIKFGAEK